MMRDKTDDLTNVHCIKNLTILTTIYSCEIGV